MTKASVCSTEELPEVHARAIELAIGGLSKVPKQELDREVQKDLKRKAKKKAGKRKK